MSLDEFPIALILAGLVAYAVLGGADFGAGFWSLPVGGHRGAKAAGTGVVEIRDANHTAAAPAAGDRAETLRA